MSTICLGVIVGFVAFLIYTYLGYPASLIVLRIFRSRERVAALREWPRITILLPAHNEARVIRKTLENLLAADYPADRRRIIVLSDASTDGTDAIVEEFGPRGIELFRVPERGGKTAAENAVVPLLDGEIVVNTDASVHVQRDAIKALVREFADPSVGVASSHNVSVARVDEHANYAESWYVSYDMWVRGLETRVSGIVGAAGCLYAARAAIQANVLEEALTRDFAAALLARAKGLRAISVPEAVCFVPRIGSLRREYRRKVRTITRGMETLYAKRALLNPIQYGTFAWILASHKACRWAIPHFGFLALLALACLAPSSMPARWALVAVGIAGMCGLLAWYWPEGRRLPRVMAVPAYLVIGNLAALHASVRAMKGYHDPIWEPTRRDAVRPVPTA